MNFAVLFEKVTDEDFPAGYYYAHVPSLGLTTHGLIAVALSGAGPTVLGFARPEDAETAGRAIAGVFEKHGVQATPVVVNIDTVGRFMEGSSS